MKHAKAWTPSWFPRVRCPRFSVPRGLIQWGCTAALAFAVCSASGHDWPQFLGPTRNGMNSGNDLAAAWPKDGPRVVWQKKIGQGFAGPVVADGKLVLFHRLGDEEIVEALDAKTGKALWRFDYPTAYRDDFGFDEGPRGMPALADGKVFTFGAEGALHCVSLADGKKLWSVDCKKEFNAPKGFFGLVCSPLVEGKAVIVNIGGHIQNGRRDELRESHDSARNPATGTRVARPSDSDGGASLVAFDKETGKILWLVVDDEPSYSSPTAATIAGQRYLLALTRGFLIGADPATGKVLFQLPFRPPQHASVTGATPIISDDHIFISAAYDTGAQLLRLRDGKPEKVWSNNESLSLHYSTPALRDGFLYGLHGRHDFPGGTELRCVEWKTGKVRWGKPGLSGANVLLAGDSLLVLTENGELVRVAADPEKFHELERAQILGRGVRAYPALANGLFYARDKDKLVCVDLK